MNSTLGKINIADIVKGLIVAAIGSALTAFYEALQTGAAPNWKQIAIVGVTSGVGYLIKNFFTNSDGQPFAPENK